MGQPIETCKNCEKEFQEGFEFCPHCGQKAKDDLTLGVLFYNTISNYFSIDARFLKSFLPLLFRPGYLAKRFVEGKRLLYLHPAQLYLFISVVFFFLFSFNVRNSVQSLDESLAKTLIKEQTIDSTLTVFQRDSIKFAKEETKQKNDSIAKAVTRKALVETSKFTDMTEEEIDSIIDSPKFKTNTNGLNFDFDEKESEIDSLIAINAPDIEIFKQMGMDDDAGFFEKKLFTQALKFYKSRKGGSILQAFYDTIPIAMFFLLPIFAFILKILYYRTGRYAHHLVFSFYFFSFLFTVLCIILGVNFIWDIPDWIDWLVATSTIFYLFLALKNFYQEHWFWSFFKTGVVAFSFLLFVIPLTAGLLAVFAFMFF